MDGLRDPVCGMPVLPDRAITAAHGGRTWYFCSEYCRDRFVQRPDAYRRAGTAFEAPGTPDERRIAYFSMEIAIHRDIPSYAGGLGVLAGDTLRACAALGVPVVGVSLLFQNGYLVQHLDETGTQHEAPVPWDAAAILEPCRETIQVQIEDRPVHIRAWQHTITGLGGHRVPIIFLDTNVVSNAREDRTLTDRLYGGDDRHRLAQEIVLGIGGIRMLRALGYTGIHKFHMNEGHASLLAIALLRDEPSPVASDWPFDQVRRRCVFTTHTPVAAGHDQFDYGLVREVAGELLPLEVLRMLGGRDRLNMTLLGLNLSGYVNGVAQRHGEVARTMFPGYPIHHVTNGIDVGTWASDELSALFDRYLPGWAADPALLRKAIAIPGQDIWDAHAAAKARLLTLVQQRTGRAFDSNRLLIGFARRATPYKRADLIFSEPAWLADIAHRIGGLQFVFAGKAHPNDQGGKDLIRRIVSVAQQLGDRVPVVYLENYDLQMAKLLVAGSDLWLNTPQAPLEASGTSGMKAALNGVPSFSVLDGWWIEGHIEGVTGWSIGTPDATTTDLEGRTRRDADDLYRKLADVIVPLFYRDRTRWIGVMRQAIALNGSYFNTHRMVQQYVTNAYLD